ncbi:7,8-dihydropterin-6-yl-methyl-4-(beta-D-ribofuranosyl)aminobenzene 5'-phosphate synthase [Halanaerobium saccharolyticum]|uniref:7, 8-dihydropterin-6-yl-methyl-4-(Beta-D-ribofuranosyl)aminobenzene 5'-phosphate synthase n=1 Tax=Halanaerobium saccharolyticum TaxID=43595 RepID=A0A4R6LKD0_9FIRM|nr:MBL fold metallo-hydrolase [Halanaerobium saccharolyticum]TDO85243.1 7,8-dihydropterin-6-yl-methyl-4-(beta-D-ribofuranosyl)aminobenzene 5'-phosphate synthase [Halanaerobium saccharolyticum]
MARRLELTILSDNTVEKRKLLAEHGLSIYFEYNEQQYLFDTGQGEVLVSNALKSGIDLKKIDTVFLSHGHDDHTGGLKKLLEINPEIRVFAHSDVFQAKYKKVDAGLEFIGINLAKSDISNFSAAETTIAAAAGVYNTGEIPAPRASYLNERYVVANEEGEKIDPFDDDTSIYIETESGIVILLGCSHKGVKNIIDEIRGAVGDKKIAAVFGGMHLKRAGRKEINGLIEYFKELDLDLLVPMHCTGRQAAVLFKEALGDVVQLASVGDKFEL